MQLKIKENGVGEIWRYNAREMFNIVYFENSSLLEYHTAESEGFYTLPNYPHFLHFRA